MKGKFVAATLDPKLVEIIDKDRGLVSRSSWIENILLEYYSEEFKKL